MSDSDDDFVEYGSALEPFDEDAIPRKRPLTLEDQVVKDAQGRRRFHGAFTGGFSAGFFNTVGSLEGWTPSSFKSSRSQRMESKAQKPEDFMDDEDTGEFGIAPQVLQATSDFNHLKRGRERVPHLSDGPISGEPVLKLLLEPVRETAGTRLLRRMGWRPGQGVGPRRPAAPRTRPRSPSPAPLRVVGCAPPPSSNADDDDDELEEGITFAPEDVPAFLCSPKADTFGLGYRPLDRRPVLSASAASSAAAEGRTKAVLLGGGKGGALAVAGQAFGVGALEEDDEDIYALEDMSQYDFALGGPASSRFTNQSSAPLKTDAWLDNFEHDANPVLKEFFPPPQLPANFQPVRKVRRSRFDQPPTQEISSSQTVHVRTATERRAIVGEKWEEEDLQERERLQAEALKITQDMADSSRGKFVPFAGHPDKQRRYEQYLALKRAGHPEKLSHLQPLSMNDWERHREKSEFEQAARLFRPLSADMGDRFVSASQPDDATDPLAKVEKFTNASTQQRDAAKMKMFGKMTREEESWQPCDLVCKRFNIAKPSVSNASISSRNHKKVSVFDFLKTAPLNSKAFEEKLKFPPALSAVESIDTSDPVLVTGDSKPDNAIETESKMPDETKCVVEPENAELSVTKQEVHESVDFPFPEPTKKIDLFKAIFLSSSESEEDEGEEEEKEKEKKDIETTEEYRKSSKNSEIELSHLVASAPASNPVTIKDISKKTPPFILKVKTGVFANLDLDALSCPVPSIPTALKASESQKPSVKSVTTSLNKSMYGPQLPAAPASSTSKSAPVLPSVIAHHQSNTPLSEWVDSTSVHRKRKEKKKKEKKHKEKKSKHKKHKHRK